MTSIGSWAGGHRFVRYADDLMVYVRSERAGQRVIESIALYVERRLKLRVNRRKSAVAPAMRRPFLGFGFFSRDEEVKVRVDLDARKRAKDRLRKLTSRRWGVSMERRIRELNRSRWAGRPTSRWPKRRARFETSTSGSAGGHGRSSESSGSAIARDGANCGRSGSPTGGPGVGRLAEGLLAHAGSPVFQRALPNAYWSELGLAGFSDPYRRFRVALRTAGCGPACPVMWEGPG